MGSVRRIPIGDFPIGKSERGAILRVLDSGRISQGREVRAFEEEFANWLGTRHCIAVSSGTAALMCGLKAMEYAGFIEPGARVLIPALTFIATANAVKLVGMEPVFGDVDEKTFCLAPAEVVRTSHDLILPVHLFGYAANLLAIARFANWKIENPYIAEDAAEAHGTVYDRHKVGTFGLWSAFSFYIAHTVQAGELGIVATDDDEIANIARSIRAHGRSCACKRCLRSEGQCPNLERGDPRFTFQYVGYNLKPMEFQAALARVQLAKVEENIERRQANVTLLTHLLEPLEGLIDPFYHQDGAVMMAYPIVLRKAGIRDVVIARLEKSGVECRPLFGCIPTQQPAYAKYKEQYEGQLSTAERCGANGFYVGCHQFLDDDDIQYMAKAIVEVVEELK